jgi:Protein of unknown function (DUF2752)
MLVLIGVPLCALALTSFPLCPFAGVLGIPCPGCGLTRATLAVLEGHLTQALEMQPLVFFVAPIYLGAAAKWSFDYVRGPRFAPRPPASRWRRAFDRGIGPFAAALALGLIVVWASRWWGYFGGPVPVESYRAWLAHGLTR